MPRLSPASLASLLGLLLLAGCGGNTAQALGFSRELPNEFEVTTRAPLTIPPDFSLPPPRPGAPRPQEQPADVAAQAVLDPQVELAGMNGANSPGQQALLHAAGRPAPRNIRQRVDREATEDASSGFTDELMFWRSSGPPGKVIDPVREAARLRRLGVRNVVAPSTLPPPPKKGLLDHIF